MIYLNINSRDEVVPSPSIIACIIFKEICNSSKSESKDTSPTTLGRRVDDAEVLLLSFGTGTESAENLSNIFT